jgi:hypothetical protein
MPGCLHTQVATIWNEVLVQQAADGHNAAAMQRLVNFDLRHTAASSGVSKPAEHVSSQPLPGVSAAAAVYDNGSGPPPGAYELIRLCCVAETCPVVCAWLCWQTV